MQRMCTDEGASMLWHIWHKSNFSQWSDECKETSKHIGWKSFVLLYQSDSCFGVWPQWTCRSNCLAAFRSTPLSACFWKPASWPELWASSWQMDWLQCLHMKPAVTFICWDTGHFLFQLSFFSLKYASHNYFLPIIQFICICEQITKTLHINI